MRHRRLRKGRILPTILDCATIALVGATLWLVSETKQASNRAIGVETWLDLEKRFDSKEMKNARFRLAAQLLESDPLKNSRSFDTDVLELFDSIGIAYRLGYLNKELAEASFSYYANRWWNAALPYIQQERQKSHDPSLFNGFEFFTAKTSRYDQTLSKEDVAEFLKDEYSSNPN